MQTDFVVLGDAPDTFLRCPSCGELHRSPYLLKGESPICEACVKSYKIPFLTARQFQVLTLLRRGFRRREIAREMGISVAAVAAARTSLRGKGFSDLTCRQLVWRDLRDGKEYSVTRIELEVLESILDRDLQFTDDYCKIVASRLGVSPKSLSNTIYRMRRRGLPVPNRHDRARRWLSKLKEEVLLKDKPVKVIAKLGGRKPHSVHHFLARSGVRIRKPSLSRMIYELLKGSKFSKLSMPAIFQEFSAKGFSASGIRSALLNLKSQGLISESFDARRVRIFKVKKRVNPEEIVTFRYRKAV